ncbi:MAG TPA: hypothetical protein VFB32_11845 [Rudaea sp.]|nr:hypothetical protein [Rudaea sp.]
MNIDDFIAMRVDDDVPAAAEPLFQRKYRRPVPDFPHHVTAAYRAGEGHAPLACYIHFTDCGDILLGGGACVDDRVLRRMSAEERDIVRAAGGIYQHALRWSVAHFAPRFAAVFGYCGDALAERIDRAVGFESTDYEHLLAYWTREVDPRKRRQMVEKANSFAPF